MIEPCIIVGEFQIQLSNPQIKMAKIFVNFKSDNEVQSDKDLTLKDIFSVEV